MLWCLYVIAEIPIRTNSLSASGGIYPLPGFFYKGNGGIFSPVTSSRPSIRFMFCTA